jgi:hypothetical protein
MASIVAGNLGTDRGFLTSVNAFVQRTKEKTNEAYQLGILDFYLAMRDATPIDTGFLRSSLTLGKNGFIPRGPNAEYGSEYNDARALDVIASLDATKGDRVTMVYQAPYAMRLEHGFTGMDSLGRYYNQAGRFWVASTGSKYRSIMRAAASRVAMSAAGV